MQSDLPHDWVLGAKLRRDSLGALARDKELPPDITIRAQVDLQRTRTEIASRSQPLLMATLWQNRLLFIPVTGEDMMITGASITIFRDGGAAIVTDP
jgi:hypothetical protein